MKIIIVGLGRIGTGLAKALSKQGHEVTAIDLNPLAFRPLGKDFKGIRIVGVGFDRDILTRAKIDRVDAVVSCTASDEANIVVARIAKTIYRVPRVVARLYDTTKADAYRRIGIQTISTTTWGIGRITELLTFHHLDKVADIGSGDVSIVRVDIPAMMVGHMVDELTAMGEIRVVSIVRESHTFIPTNGAVFEEGDIVYAAVTPSGAGRMQSILGIRT